MKFSIMWKNDILADIETTPRSNDVIIKKYNNSEIGKQLFYKGRIDRERIYNFVKSRCFEPNRADIKEILKEMNLEEYNPWEMIKITHGVDWDDFYWIRFEGEDLTWEDVRVRK